MDVRSLRYCPIVIPVLSVDKVDDVLGSIDIFQLPDRYSEI